MTVNLWTGQNKESNSGLQFANTNKMFNGTPEKVRQDYLEKPAIKAEPRNIWRDDDQIGFSGNSRGRFFPYTCRNSDYSSEPGQQEKKIFVRADQNTEYPAMNLALNKTIKKKFNVILLGSFLTQFWTDKS
ncbi:hypothetical protein BpHYR1_037899 [Brachionus plicatilis]|uniref:Uncharacterized protein n=1 Tax=Brachionus plicatilis TaxID=10195 RepID=A0A3M7T3M2_BRAPC|nr:hypothetical protein BpHYR1_037899 [Brachionus plicatilis]